LRRPGPLFWMVSPCLALSRDVFGGSLFVADVDTLSYALYFYFYAGTVLY